jgi:NAD(P)-dependent dehydrogenase (short-subunit alcohol dehydrogenase family)
MVDPDKSASIPGKILITGGTSGLGLKLVRFFLQKGFEVVATGRREVSIPEYQSSFTFVLTDFGDLFQTSCALKRICETSRFDIVINNAGILSPPDFTQTDDGLEYTFQVNFLSHLLVNEIILKKTGKGRPLLIAAIVSPVYRIAEKDLRIQASDDDYNPLRAYSNSKLYLALMCYILPLKYPDLNLTCIGFDPGVFSSNISRMQKHWFRILYRVAAPFMSNPGKLAGRFYKTIRRKDLINGAIYKTGKRKGVELQTNTYGSEIFWQECYKKIEPYVK